MCNVFIMLCITCWVFKMDYFLVRNGILCVEMVMLDCVEHEKEIGGNRGSTGVLGLLPEEQDGGLRGDRAPARVAPGVTGLDAAGNCG